MNYINSQMDGGNRQFSSRRQSRHQLRCRLPHAAPTNSSIKMHDEDADMGKQPSRWAPRTRPGRVQLKPLASSVAPWLSQEPDQSESKMVWAPSRRKLGERRVVIRAAPPTASPKPQPQPLSLSDLAKDKPLVLPRSYSTSSDASSSSSSSSAVRTLIPCDQKSNLWLELRESRATASILSQICGVSPFADGRGNPRHDIFMQKLGLKKVSVNVAMNHGNVTEPIALAEYEKRSGRKVASAGFISYRASADEEDFIGGSPDGIILGSDDSFAAMREALSADGPIDESLLRQVLRDGGVLEIKCPYASQPKYRKSPSDQTDKNARYMFQIQVRHGMHMMHEG